MHHMGKSTYTHISESSCIFTCMFSTKAVHIELASDLTSEAFLTTPTRFVARRGVSQDHSF